MVSINLLSVVFSTLPLLLSATPLPDVSDDSSDPITDPAHYSYRKAMLCSETYFEGQCEIYKVKDENNRTDCIQLPDFLKEPKSIYLGATQGSYVPLYRPNCSFFSRAACTGAGGVFPKGETSNDLKGLVSEWLGGPAVSFECVM